MEDKNHIPPISNQPPKYLIPHNIPLQANEVSSYYSESVSLTQPHCLAPNQVWKLQNAAIELHNLFPNAYGTCSDVWVLLPETMKMTNEISKKWCIMEQENRLYCRIRVCYDSGSTEVIVTQRLYDFNLVSPTEGPEKLIQGLRYDVLNNLLVYFYPLKHLQNYLNLFQ